MHKNKNTYIEQPLQIIKKIKMRGYKKCRKKTQAVIQAVRI